jgi:hypothetical protein
MEQKKYLHTIFEKKKKVEQPIAVAKSSDPVRRLCALLLPPRTSK